MIRGIHGLFYSSDPNATRAFFRDKVKLPGNDVGAGWWIFDFAEGDLGVHPTTDPAEAGVHDISFYCDDIEGTVATLKARGVRFTQGIADQGYGLVTYFSAPGGLKVQLYEPRYTKGARRSSARVAAKKTKRSSPRGKPAAPARAGRSARTPAPQPKKKR